jgi:hypothetical protein
MADRIEPLVGKIVGGENMVPAANGFYVLNQIVGTVR